MAKFSTPGVSFNEIDNTVRSNSVPGLGIGAIVLKSNKGPVNQRILTSSYDNFTQIYGEPENLDDFGHFVLICNWRWKFILSMDKSINNDYNGIKVRNIISWLLDSEE